MAHRTLYALTAAGTALTNSTTHTQMAAYTLPGSSIATGKRFHVHGSAIATATNSTDTFRLRLFAGPTTLTGTALVDGTAVDVADNDKIVWDLWLTCRASGVVIVSGFASIEGVEGTVTARVAFESLTVADVTAALIIEATGVWSVASASNSARVDSFFVDEYV